MEVFVAKFDYEKEREDILSFKEGDMFRIVSKADMKWWAAYALTSGEYGYVPSIYLERYVDPTEGVLVQALSESSAGETKRQALRELKNKIPPTPAASSNALSSEEEDSEDSDSGRSDGGRDEPVIIKPLIALNQPPEDCSQIEPKRLLNPVLESKLHLKLHKELKLNNARGGVQNLGKPELERVMQRRKPDADGRPGPIREGRRGDSTTSSADNELATQLARRSQLLQEAQKQDEVEVKKPEFMKISLRKTPQPR